MRIPRRIFDFKLFPTTLLPMGLATASGSIISVVIFVSAFAVLMRKNKEMAVLVAIAVNKDGYREV